MRILTENELIIQKGGRNADNYWSANGSKKKGKGLADKAKGLVGSGKVQGVLAALSTPQNSGPIDTSYTPEGVKGGMSIGAKIGIGVGVALVIGVGIYFLTKPKGG